MHHKKITGGPSYNKGEKHGWCANLHIRYNVAEVEFMPQLTNSELMLNLMLKLEQVLILAPHTPVSYTTTKIRGARDASTK